MLRINDEAPDFTAETSQGTIHFHEWIGNGWAILFSHPKDFTPVCTTELGYMAGLQPEFEKRNCRIIGLSVDEVRLHSKANILLINRKNGKLIPNPSSEAVMEEIRKLEFVIAAHYLHLPELPNEEEE